LCNQWQGKKQGEALVGKVSDAAHTTQDKASKAVHEVSDKAHTAAHNAKDAAVHAGENVQSTISGFWEGR